MKLWHGLCGLDNDPHPGVAIMAQKVTNHIRNQVEQINVLMDPNDPILVYF